MVGAIREEVREAAGAGGGAEASHLMGLVTVGAATGGVGAGLVGVTGGVGAGVGVGVEVSGIIRGGPPTSEDFGEVKLAFFFTRREEKKDPKERMGSLGEATDSGERRGSITFSGAGRAQSKTVGE